MCAPVCVDAEHDQSASTSTALPAYSFDNIGGPFATVGSSVSAVANTGRYIQDDLPMTTVMLPDGTSLPLSSFAANSSGFAQPGMANGLASAALGASYSQAQPGAATALDPMVCNSDSLNLAANVSGAMTSDELTQFLQSGPVLTEMQSEEFLRQIGGLVFQQASDSTAGHQQSSGQ